MQKSSLRILSSLAFFTLAPLTSAFAAAAPPVEAFEEKSVASIEVSLQNPPPGSSFDPKTVISRLKTKIGDPFSQTTFDSDLKALSDQFDRVEPTISVHNSQVYVLLKVWPRPQIRSIKWEGNTHFKTKTLQKELRVKPSSTFNRQAFNKSFNKLKEFYVKKGYFEAELQYTLHQDPKTNEIDIQIHVKEGRAGKIDEIAFKGFSGSEESELLGMIQTKKYNFFTGWFTGKGIYNEEALDQDKLIIVNFLQNRGYADAKVDIQILEAEKEGKIVIQISTVKGPVFHFGQITFNGNTLFTDKEVESRFLVHPEDVYSPELLRDTAQAVKEMYGRRGYIDASVHYETQLVEDSPVYNVNFEIEEGQQYKIGMIHVIGNLNTQTHVILRESLLIPGETFDSAKLKATQGRLENIGYFKSVNVYAVRTQEDQSLGENYRDVFIEVKEAHTGSVSLFGGFSSADSIFGGVDLTESNFNIKGWSKLFKKGAAAMRGAGEYAHARINIGSKQRTYSVSWMTPYFKDTLWRVGFTGDKAFSRLTAEDYTVNTLGLSLFASYPLTPYWTFGWRYRVRYERTTVSRDATPEERRQAKSHGLLSATGVSLNFDSTDSANKPHRGYRSFIEADFTGIGGNFSFFRFGYTNSYYQPIWKKGTMKYRFDFRFIEPVWKTSNPNDIPISERFFLGGESSVRGYRPFDLGPHFGNGDPKGGVSSSLFSVEYMQELFSFLDGFVFVDAGSVSMRKFSLGHYNLSYGVGVRIEVISRMPVTLGIGFPVNPDFDEQVRRFFFTMGGQF